MQRRTILQMLLAPLALLAKPALGNIPLSTVETPRPERPKPTGSYHVLIDLEAGHVVHRGLGESKWWAVDQLRLDAKRYLYVLFSKTHRVRDLSFATVQNHTGRASQYLHMEREYTKDNLRIYHSFADCCSYWVTSAGKEPKTIALWMDSQRLATAFVQWAPCHDRRITGEIMGLTPYTPQNEL